MIERPRHIRAFEAYYFLGEHRSLRKAAKVSGNCVQSLCEWRKLFDWDKRIFEWKKRGITRETRARQLQIRNLESDLPVVGSVPISSAQGFVMDLLTKCTVVIEDCFKFNDEGDLGPRFKITDADEFSKMIKAMKELADLLDRIQHREGKGGKDDKSTKIDKAIILLGEMSDQSKLQFIRGIDIGTAGGAQGGVQEADYTEVSDKPTEDGS